MKRKFIISLFFLLFFCILITVQASKSTLLDSILKVPDDVVKIIDSTMKGAKKLYIDPKTTLMQIYDNIAKEAIDRTTTKDYYTRKARIMYTCQQINVNSLSAELTRLNNVGCNVSNSLQKIQDQLLEANPTAAITFNIQEGRSINELTPSLCQNINKVRSIAIDYSKDKRSLEQCLVKLLETNKQIFFIMTVDDLKKLKQYLVKNSNNIKKGIAVREKEGHQVLKWENFINMWNIYFKDLS